MDIKQFNNDYIFKTHHSILYLDHLLFLKMSVQLSQGSDKFNVFVFTACKTSFGSIIRETRVLLFSTYVNGMHLLWWNQVSLRLAVKDP